VPFSYPILVDLAARPVVVVGGGRVAERKVAGLLDAGADVTVVSQAATAGLAELAACGRLRLLGRGYQPGDLAGARLAVAATGDPAVDQAVADEAGRLGILVNVAGDPERGSCATAAVLRRGDLVVAVGTAGRAPGLAGALRRRLEAALGPEWAELVGILAAERDRLPAAGDVAAWDELLGPEVLAAVRRGEHDTVREAVRTCRSSSSA
jgi:precorrin-2 dehydrogenase / sirohydrochlorin ferrochelatase